MSIGHEGHLPPETAFASSRCFKDSVLSPREESGDLKGQKTTRGLCHCQHPKPEVRGHPILLYPGGLSLGLTWIWLSLPGERMCLALGHHTSAAVSVLKPLLALAGLGVSPFASVKKESLVLRNERQDSTARQARLDPRIRQERHTGVCMSHKPQSISSGLQQRLYCPVPYRS